MAANAARVLSSALCSSCCSNSLQGSASLPLTSSGAAVRQQHQKDSFRSSCCLSLPLPASRPKCRSSVVTDAFNNNASEATAGELATCPLALHVGESTISLPVTRHSASELAAAITQLLGTFKAKEAAVRPQRWPALDFKCRTENAENKNVQGAGGNPTEQKQGGSGAVTLEVFCNPNAYANAFQAKVLVTVTSPLVKVTCEGALSALKADVDTLLESSSVST